MDDQSGRFKTDIPDVGEVIAMFHSIGSRSVFAGALGQRSRGFTLVELIMVIVLLGILATVGSNMLSDSFTTTRIVNDSKSVEAEARYALDRLVREIRQVRRTGSAYSVSAASSSVLQFIKSDGSTVRINYDATAKTVQLDYASTSATTLVRDVSSFGLTYYGIDNTVLTTLSSIQSSAAYVGVSLSVTDPMISSVFTQNALAALRNQ